MRGLDHSYHGTIDGTQTFTPPAGGYTETTTFSGASDLVPVNSRRPFYVARNGSVTVSVLGSGYGCTFEFDPRQVQAQNTLFALDFDGKGGYDIGETSLASTAGTRHCPPPDGDEGAYSVEVPLDPGPQLGNSGDGTIAGSRAYTDTSYGTREIQWQWSFTLGGG